MTLLARWDSSWQIAWNVLATGVFLYAVVRVARVPAGYFKHGRRTKVFWLFV